MKTKPTYILVVVSNNYIYTTFWKTIHYKSEVNEDNIYEIIDESKSTAFDLFSNPMHSNDIVKKITTSKNVNDEIIFSLLECIDGEYYTTNNIENKLNDIIEDNKTK